MCPADESVSPRTKLPPPTTTASWIPIFATWAISCAVAVSSLASRPKPPSRQRPSPEILSRMRLYFASAMQFLATKDTAPILRGGQKIYEWGRLNGRFFFLALQEPITHPANGVDHPRRFSKFL